MGLVHTAFRTYGVLLLPFGHDVNGGRHGGKAMMCHSNSQSNLANKAKMCSHRATLAQQVPHPVVMSTTSHHWQCPLPRPVKHIHLQAPLTHS